jgi:hypothetical protein
MGDAEDAIAGDLKRGVTLPVAFEGGTGVMVGVPVELDDEPAVMPEDVDLAPLDDYVRLRAGERGGVAEVEEPPLELGAGDRRRPAVLTEDLLQRPDTALSATPRDDRLNRPQVEQP